MGPGGTGLGMTLTFGRSQRGTSVTLSRVCDDVGRKEIRDGSQGAPRTRNRGAQVDDAFGNDDRSAQPKGGNARKHIVLGHEREITPSGLLRRMALRKAHVD